MKIVLIYPPEIFSVSQVASAVLPPLGIAFIAANLKKHGHEVILIDAIGEEPEQYIDFGKHRIRGLAIEDIIDRIPADADWVGVSSLYSYMWPAAVATIRATKERYPDMRIVVGGPHPSAYPELVMREPGIDFTIVSEAEHSVLDFIDALEGNRPFRDVDGLVWRDNDEIYRTPKTRYLNAQELDELPLPSRDMLPMENYIQCKESHGANRGRSTTVLASRGCPYKCSFCTTPQLWTTKFRVRSASKVVDEIMFLKETYGVTDIHFVDDNLTVSRKWTKEFSRELIDRKANVSWQLSTGVRVETVDRPTLDLMKESGCENITFAPESGNERVLREVLNKTIRPEKVIEAAKEALDAGMKVCLFFIVGAPGETKEEAEDTIKYARKLAKLGVDEASFSKFSPLPGTQLFRMLESEGNVKINREFYESLGYQSELGRAFSWNKEMTNEVLRKITLKAFISFYVTSFLWHPFKAIRTTLNVFRRRQETKLDRYVQRSLRAYLQRLFGKSNPKQFAPQAWPEEPAIQDVVIKQIPLPSDVPAVSLEG